MPSVVDLAEDNRRLRRTLRDLVALSTLPAVWKELSPEGIASSLANVLLNTLPLHLVFVRIGGRIELARIPGVQQPSLPVVRALLADALDEQAAAPPNPLPDFWGRGPLHLTVTRFSIGESEGVVVSGSREPSFPTERDRLVLSVAANHTATALQRRDAEDQKVHAEAHLRQVGEEALERLTEADHRKNEFIATLAHELRNPLAPIRTGLQVLKHAGHDGAAAERARAMMDRQLDQMVRLIDDLMDVSRITSGKMELRRERVQLSAVVKSAIETSLPLLEKMQHDLRVKLPDEPVSVSADLTRLAQVFMNLLNNAAKYEPAAAKIELCATRQGDAVVVSVKDEGIGIPAKYLPSVFDMFAQVQRSQERSQGGLGIGLTLVKRLVGLHGGTVEARSAGLHLGSEFIVRLPVSKEAIAPAPQPVAEVQPQQSSLRILIVDDNEDGADSLGLLLHELGNDIRVAYDGEQALAESEAFSPDVVLLDIGLPRLSGHDVCRRLRAQPGGEKRVLIAQTGWGQLDDRQRTLEAGFDYHLVKPLDVNVLDRLLSAHRPGGRQGA